MIIIAVFVFLLESQSSQASELTFNDITFTSAHRGFCVGDSGVVYGTFDGGHTWSRIKLSIHGDCTRVKFSDPQHGWILVSNVNLNTHSNALLRTVDGGDAWSGVRLDSLPCDCRSTSGAYILFDIFPFDADTIFVTTLTNILVKSYDAGKTWAEIDSLPSGNGTVRGVSGVHFATSSRGFAYEGFWSDWDLGWGALYSTFNGDRQWIKLFDALIARASIPTQGGTSWFLTTSIQVVKQGVMLVADCGDSSVLKWAAPFSKDRNSSNAADLYALNDSTCWVVGTSVWKSDDCGESWQALCQLDYRSYPRKIRFNSVNRGFIIGSRSTFLQTSDGGRSWHPVKLK